MEGQSDRCLECGAPSTGGRYCTSCGADLATGPGRPLAWSSPTDTAERVYEAPAPTYPVTSTPPRQPATPRVREPTHLAPGGPARPAPGPGLWLGVAAAMMVVLALGSFLLVHGTGGGGEQQTSPTPPPVAPRTNGSRSATPDGSTSPSETPSSSAPTVAGPPVDVAGLAQVTAPTHAPAGADVSGRPVTYVAANMVDGRNDTCWRAPGDATGMVLTFRLDQPTRLTRVGLVNGYAKNAYADGRVFDWYLGNRRVLAVDWIFDDGRTVTQTLHQDRAMQQIPVTSGTTSVVRLRITRVSPPGEGRAGRDDTAISEVALVGRTAA